MKYIIGIDPGKSGGLTVMDEYGCLIDVQAMTKMTDADISDWFAEWSEGYHVFAYLEKVHSMPGQGVASTFKFGDGSGFLRGCLVSRAIPFEFVTPQKWQKYLSCQTKGDKNITKSKAQQLFPDMKITHAIADSILIAEYGRRVRV